MKKGLPVLFTLALCANASAAPAHVHGEARLEIVVDSNVLSIHLETPLDGLLGFEHAPRSPAEKQAVQTMKATLAQPERLFLLAAEAGCKAAAPQLESPLFGGQAADDHLDLDADYRWQCAKPAALREMTTRLFVEFPKMQRIKVEFAGPGGQKSGHLTPQQPRFAW